MLFNIINKLLGKKNPVLVNKEDIKSSVSTISKLAIILGSLPQATADAANALIFTTDGGISKYALDMTQRSLIAIEKARTLLKSGIPECGKVNLTSSQTGALSSSFYGLCVEQMDSGDGKYYYDDTVFVSAVDDTPPVATVALRCVGKLINNICAQDKPEIINVLIALGVLAATAGLIATGVYFRYRCQSSQHTQDREDDKQHYVELKSTHP